MILEISYTYKEDKNSNPQVSWTYYKTTTDDMKKAIGEAGKYFTKFKRENGWTKQATLKEIRLIPNEHEEINVVRVNPEPRVVKSKPRKRTQKSRSLPKT